MSLPALVLVIEDDPTIRRLLAGTLENAGHRVVMASSAAQGLAVARDQTVDLIVLDLGLPDTDGLELIQQLRSRDAPEILVLSARSAESVKVRALDEGADDYLTKPFAPAELLARVKVALRRRRPGAADPQSVELKERGLRIDLARHQVLRDGAVVHLTPIEFRLLATLVRHGDKILTHEQLLVEVWGPGQETNTHYLRIYLGGLRKKLERDPAHPRVLLTVPGVGYRLSLETGE
jgi:two-component system KDP operon response regulator KdpE